MVLRLGITIVKLGEWTLALPTAPVGPAADNLFSLFFGSNLILS